MTQLLALWRQHRILVLAFALAVMMLGVFAFRTVSSAIYWMDPAHQDQPVAGWMTPFYVAQSYDLPPQVLLPALFIDPSAPRERITLRRIADQNDVSLAELQSRIDAAAAAHRAEQDAQCQSCSWHGWVNGVQLSSSA